MFFALNSIKKPKKQFNLLHLETSEHYFLSLKVSLHINQKYDEQIQLLIFFLKRVRGKLHLCSRSLVFEPKVLKLPLMKMKYSNNLFMKILKNFDHKQIHQVLCVKWDQQMLQEDIDTLDLNQVLQFQKRDTSTTQNELAEKLYVQNKNQKKTVQISNALPINAFLIKVEKLFIINRNPISPYITETSDDNLVFSISRSNSKQNLIRFLKLYQGLNECEDEQQYLNVIVSATLSEGISEQKLQSSLLGNKIEVIYKAKQIKPEGTIYGIFTIFREEYAQFVPLVNSPKGHIIHFTMSDVKYFLKYRYMFKNQGIELWLHNKQRSLLFVFDDQLQQEQIYKYIYKKSNKNSLQNINKEKALEYWMNGQLTNYEYLIILNTLANRSFNDLSAYPIFPWIISEYGSEEFAINQPAFFRDLSKPIGALNKHRLQKYKAFYSEQLKDKNPDAIPYLFPTHYSSPGTVVFYLIRKIPEFVIKLQNGVFGPTDRIFRGLESTWYTTLNLHADSKEMIPEFYSQDCDFLINCDKLELGVTQEGEIIDDAVMPKWADNISDFVIKMRVALESEYITCNINKWIDLIFGNKSRGEEALANDNLFYPYTYNENVSWDRCRTSIERQALETQVSEFGQVPIQLFQQGHPVRKLKIQPSLKSEEEKKELQKQNQILLNKNQKLTQMMESGDQNIIFQLQNQIQSLQWENDKLKFNLETVKQEMQVSEKIETFTYHYDQEELDKNGFDFMNDDSMIDKSSTPRNNKLNF